ncbi:related to galactinol synthase [Rhynchosporium secalis]|uniref:Related to galactinol synthase n=1 Tax=Rhynchosporium secalis TaxID=38038 RepID=A0A1E1M200_RHYSE|nr:related to galactinol synthase [Rhynchosporium secalis]
MEASSNSHEKAWVTLLTRTSYIPGVVLLAHSLQKHMSKYPLLILYTPSLPNECLPALRREASLTNAVLKPTEPLIPKEQRNLIAARFEDTWTKLRIFELFEYERLVFLDADMLVFRNMDELFDIALPGRDWIAANHCCVCNLDKDEWAPKDWVKENCAYTGLTHPSCLGNPTGVPNDGQGLGTHTLLNSGLFICTPHEQLWKELLHFLETSPLVKNFMFPDQDFLAEFFRGRWQALGYQYNALKTMKYWHPEMWRDEEVRNLHYIVDKPWTKRVDSDGTAGYLGKDGETHRWWWDEFGRWEVERENMGEGAVLGAVRMSSAAISS